MAGKPMGFIDGVSASVRRAIDDVRRRLTVEEEATVVVGEHLESIDADLVAANADLAALAAAVDAVTLDAAELTTALNELEDDLVANTAALAVAQAEIDAAEAAIAASAADIAAAQAAIAAAEADIAANSVDIAANAAAVAAAEVDIAANAAAIVVAETDIAAAEAAIMAAEADIAANAVDIAAAEADIITNAAAIAANVVDIAAAVSALDAAELDIAANATAIAAAESAIDAAELDIANKIDIGNAALDVNGGLVTIDGNKITADSIIASDIIATGTITANEIATNAITAVKINAGAVTTAKINAGAVTATEIATDAITAVKILAGAITTAKIAAGAITANEIATNAVTATKILAGAVTAGKIAADAVTATEIAAGAITASEIAANAVTATAINAGAVTTAKVAAGAITANEIATNAITAVKISAGAVTAGKVAADAITATEIAAGAVTASEIAANAVTATAINALAVTTAKLDAGAVTAAKITANTITANEIATGTITATQIAANTITASQIAANAITTAKLATDAIKSLNYDGPDGAEVFADAGSFFDLAGGNIVTKGLRVDGASGDTYIRGDITAEALSIEVGTVAVVAEITTSGALGTDVFTLGPANGLGGELKMSTASVLGSFGLELGQGDNNGLLVKTFTSGSAYREARLSAKHSSGSLGSVSVQSTEFGTSSVAVSAGIVVITGPVTLNTSTASRVLTTDGSKVLTSSAVTTTELGYLDGVTSSVQTQLNGKLALTGGTLSGSLTASTIYTDGWFRSTGATGWYNQYYGGGWYMTDTNFIRSYNGKVVCLVRTIDPVSWSGSQLIVESMGTTSRSAQIAFHANGVAPILAAVGTGEQIHVKNNPNSAYAPIAASAFNIGSSLRFKTDVTEADDAAVLGKAKAVRPIKFRDRVRPQSMRTTARFRDLDARWRASGKSPLEAKPAQLESFDHDCDADECNGTAKNPCGWAMSDTERFGFAAEAIYEILPEAVWLDDTRTPAGIDVSQIASLALAGVGALGRENEALRARVDSLEARLAALEAR